MTLESLACEYSRHAYTHAYIFGWASRGIVYGARVLDGRQILPEITYLTRASGKNGGRASLRYRPNRQQIALISACAVEIREICTEEALEAEFRATKWNRGQIFERIAATAFGGYQVGKANANFTESGDIVIGDTHYQVKYNKATITDERTLQNLVA